MIQLHKISYKFIVLFLHSNQKGLAPRNMLGFGTIYCFDNLILDTFSCWLSVHIPHSGERILSYVHTAAFWTFSAVKRWPQVLKGSPATKPPHWSRHHFWCCLSEGSGVSLSGKMYKSNVLMSRCSPACIQTCDLGLITLFGMHLSWWVWLEPQVSPSAFSCPLFYQEAASVGLLGVKPSGGWPSVSAGCHPVLQLCKRADPATLQPQHH